MDKPVKFLGGTLRRGIGFYYISHIKVRFAQLHDATTSQQPRCPHTKNWINYRHEPPPVEVETVRN